MILQIFTIDQEWYLVIRVHIKWFKEWAAHVPNESCLSNFLFLKISSCFYAFWNIFIYSMEKSILKILIRFLRDLKIGNVVSKERFTDVQPGQRQLSQRQADK